jgi:hypothetical protein
VSSNGFMGDMKTRSFTYNLNRVYKTALLTVTDTNLVLFWGRFWVDKLPLYYKVCGVERKRLWECI